MVPALVSIERLNELLNDRLEELLTELIGGAKRGRQWYAASSRDGGIGDSLQVGLYGHKRGKWFHHAATKGGDTLGLIAYLRTGNDMRRAIAWAKDFLGGTVPEDTEDNRKLREQRARLHAAKDKREREAAEGRARYTWFKKSEDIKPGSPAWCYLDRRLQGNLVRLGRMPGCLRYVPALYNAQLDRELPAMVAAIVDARGKMVGLHRTYLVERSDGWDRLRASDGEGRDGRELLGKKVLGSWRGCTIRLWAGNRVNTQTGEVKKGLPWPKLPPRSAILLTEGIETGLTLALVMPARRIACAIGVGGFVEVELPACFSDVTIAAENDGDNINTAASIERAKERHAGAGRTLHIVYPPPGMDDWNTVLKEMGRAA